MTEVNIRALRERDAEGASLLRYGDVARILTNDDAASPEDASHWLRQTCDALSIPPLRTYGIREADIGELVAKAARANSMKANPIVLTAGELHEILERAI